jgi:sugar phosphate isomerase/epimerase
MALSDLDDGGEFGIIQGRLTPTPPGVLQRFPDGAWEAEFAQADELGMRYIELLVEHDHNPSNPFWSDEGQSEIRAVAKEHGSTPYSVCVDYVMPNPLNASADTVDYCRHVVSRAGSLGISLVVLPLLEAGELTLENQESFVGPLQELADAGASAGVTLALETAFDGAALNFFLERVARSNVKATYDTGNRAAFGHNIPGDIRTLGDQIVHVHIKDKNAANENVRLGTGLVNFMAVAEALVAIRYSGNFTFETTRGEDAIRTARYNIDLVTYFIAEAHAAVS